MKTFLLAVILLCAASAQASTISILEGSVVPNAAQHQGQATSSFGIAYEDQFSGALSPLHYVVSYINQGTLHQGTLDGEKRDGFTFELKVPAHLTDKLQVAFQIGPYFIDTTFTYPHNLYRDATTVALVHGVSVQYNITNSVGVSAQLQRTDFAGAQGGSDGFYTGVVFTF